MQYSVAVFSSPEADSDVVSNRFVRLAVPNKRVKFPDTRLTILEKCDPKPSAAVAFSAILSAV